MYGGVISQWRNVWHGWRQWRGSWRISGVAKLCIQKMANGEETLASWPSCENSIYQLALNSDWLSNGCGGGIQPGEAIKAAFGGNGGSAG